MGATHEEVGRVQNTSTIAAIVTSLGGPPGAVGIVRLSGPSAVTIVGRIFQPARRKKSSDTSTWQPTSHVVEYGVVKDSDGCVIDEVPFVNFYFLICMVYSVFIKCYSSYELVTLYGLQVLAVPMLAPKSYTREDVVELQCHGSEVCLRRVLRTCLEAGARLAEQGYLLVLAYAHIMTILFKITRYCRVFMTFDST